MFTNVSTGCGPYSDTDEFDPAIMMCCGVSIVASMLISLTKIIKFFLNHNFFLFGSPTWVPLHVRRRISIRARISRSCQFIAGHSDCRWHLLQNGQLPTVITKCLHAIICLLLLAEKHCRTPTNSSVNLNIYLIIKLSQKMLFPWLLIKFSRQ